MKNLLSQLVIAGIRPDGFLTKKSEAIFGKFTRSLEGKYFVGIDDKNQTVRFRIGYIHYHQGNRTVTIDESAARSSGVTIHASKLNWFNTPTKGSGAWIEGCGSII